MALYVLLKDSILVKFISGSSSRERVGRRVKILYIFLGSVVWCYFVSLKFVLRLQRSIKLFIERQKGEKKHKSIIVYKINSFV